MPVIRVGCILVVLVGTAHHALSQPASFEHEHEVLAGDPVPPTNVPSPGPTSDDLARAADAAAELAKIGGDDDLARAADAAAELAAVRDDADLARAADATAEVATIQAAAAPAGSAAQPSADDIDLRSLGLDPASAGATAFDDKLNLYGFADIGYTAQHWAKLVAGTNIDSTGFMFGNLNLYMAKNLTARVRAMAEVRFTFLPNASANPDGTVVDTTVSDADAYGRLVQWGGIIVERAYLEYDLTDYATIRAGHWLTPYGIWNTDHGSPVIIATTRPYIVLEQLFPEHQTGLELFGTRAVGAFKIGYHLTASNGRGGSEAQLDRDQRLAFGGRVEVETPWGLRLGGSYYRGRFTGSPTTAGVAPETYLEAAYGADLQLDRGALHVQAELIAHERHYATGQRFAASAGFAPDIRDVGYYVIAGYRFERLWNMMPYYYYEHFEPGLHPYFERASGQSLGLNFRPMPSVVLKVMGSYIPLSPGQGVIADNQMWELTTQAAWVF